MGKKPLALIVEDKPYWINIFEEVLKPDFYPEKARTVNEASTIIEKNSINVSVALVDIRLLGESDRSGLDVLYMLKLYGIPTVATSIYDDAQSVRDAFVLGGVRDFWFKDKQRTIELRDIIKKVIEETNNTDRRFSKKKIGEALWPFFLAIVGFPLIVFATLIAVVLLTPENLVVAVLGGGIVLIALSVVSLALFINRITGEQFAEVIKEILKPR